MPPATKKDPIAEVVATLGQGAVARFAAEAMEPLGDTGPLRGEANGNVILVLSPDLVLTFRPLTTAEFETLAGIDLTEGGAALGWWRTAAELLGAGAYPESNDTLPLWLSNPIYVRQAINHWMLRPTQAPGT